MHCLRCGAASSGRQCGPDLHERRTLKNPIAANLIRLPKDLDSVSTVAEHEVAPSSLGLRDAVRDQIWDGVRKLYKSRTQPGIALALRYKGELILDRAIGHARGNGPHKDGHEPQLLTPDSPVCLFSASKAVTAMLVHKLAEDGLIRLHDPVAEYIPEFATAGKQYITVGHVLSHRGGIPTIKQKTPDPSILWDWEGCVDLLCKARARPDAGITQAYHAVTGGFILGEIMRRVTGMELNELLDRTVRKPLGAKHFSYGLPAEHRDQVALNYFTGYPAVFPLTTVVRNALGGSFEQVCEVSNSAEFMDAVIPAGNIYATAREACDFFEALRQGGSFGGQRLFKRATIVRAIAEASPRQFDRTLLVPLRASEGFMLGDYPIGLYGPRTSEAFGHLGFINIFCWADPAREISVSLLSTGKPLIAGHLLPLAGLLKRISQAFPKL